MAHVAILEGSPNRNDDGSCWRIGVIQRVRVIECIYGREGEYNRDKENQNRQQIYYMQKTN